MPSLPMPSLPMPTGTVTFLFTDIEGSTKLWEASPEAMKAALARHDAILRECIESNDGCVFKTIGDAFCAAFPTAADAISAGLAAQTGLNREAWPEPLSIQARMALHTGAVEVRDNDYFGPPLNRVARLLSTGYGGQTILSQVTYDLGRDSLPLQAALQDLGEHRLKDLARPEHVFQLLHPGLPGEFPALKSLDSAAYPNNLLQQVTSFIGREKELLKIQDRLSKTRLLTLTGAGGSGKSRLSLQAAAELLENFPDGAFLVELAPLADSSLIVQTVANVLSIREETGKPLLKTLTAHLRTKNLLLLPDNCEHVLDASAALADALLRNCPGVKTLATSREGLGIAGEATYRVPSLSLPNPKQVQTPKVSPTSRPLSCSLNALFKHSQISPSRTKTRLLWLPFVFGSMGFRSLSNWPPPAPARSRSRTSTANSTSVSACSRAALGWRCPGSRPCAH